MSQPTSHTCTNCGNQFIGKFCNQCGEKVYSLHDKKIIHFIEEGFHFITHFEGTLFTTIKTIFSKPGQLSKDYCNGIRKKYFKPIPLYLLLVILYLLFPILEGLNMQLKYYPNQMYYGSYAETTIVSKLQETGYTKEALANAFHQKSEKASKFLLLSLIPFTALFFYAFTFWRRTYFFDQMVFAAEINAFYLMWGFLILPLLLGVFNKTYFLFTHQYLPLSDALVGGFIYFGTTIFCVKAFKEFYRFVWWQSLLLLVLFYFAHTFIVYSLYKFLLFVTVIHQIH
jgi:hypothetical protein